MVTQQPSPLKFNLCLIVVVGAVCSGAAEVAGECLHAAKLVVDELDIITDSPDLGVLLT